MTEPTSQIWTVTAEFADRDDAVALVDLLREMGYKTDMKFRTINSVVGNPASTWRSSKLMMAGMVAGRSYSIEDLAAIIEPHGFTATSAPSLAAALTREGVLQRIAHGVYRLVASPVVPR